MPPEATHSSASCRHHRLLVQTVSALQRSSLCVMFLYDAGRLLIMLLICSRFSLSTDNRNERVRLLKITVPSDAGYFSSTSNIKASLVILNAVSAYSFSVPNWLSFGSHLSHSDFKPSDQRYSQLLFSVSYPRLVLHTLCLRCSKNEVCWESIPVTVRR